nr:copia protein [Tanacetum cinerariifolium]
MDVKSAFLNGKMKEEVYVKQLHGFIISEFPDYVCKLDKTLYGLKQAPTAWYETLSTFLIQNKFARGRIDNTFLIYKSKGNVLFVQVYVDDIIFGSTSYKLCRQFKKLMRKKFEIILCARYQSNPKESPLIAVKRILKYLKGTPTLGLYHPKCLGFDLKGYSNSDYAGCNMDKKAPQDVKIVGNKMHKAFLLPGESSHWQYKFPLPVEGVPTARRIEILLPGVCTAMMKKLPVKEN